MWGADGLIPLRSIAPLLLRIRDTNPAEWRIISWTFFPFHNADICLAGKEDGLFTSKFGGSPNFTCILVVSPVTRKSTVRNKVQGVSKRMVYSLAETIAEQEVQP